MEGPVVDDGRALLRASPGEVEDGQALLATGGDAPRAASRYPRMYVGVCLCLAVVAAIAAGECYYGLFVRGGGGGMKRRESLAKLYLIAKFKKTSESMKHGFCPDMGEDVPRDINATRDLEPVDPKTFPASRRHAAEAPPAGITREGTIYGRCACQAGLYNVTVWPDGRREESITVRSDEARWIRWEGGATHVHWFCSGMHFGKKSEVHLASNQWFSVELTTANQNNVFGPLGCCGGKPSGFLHMNTWREADYDVSIPFTSGTGGFSCFKIPAMLRTHNGTFIAFAEARRNGCSDFSATVLVYRRSTDGGRTWGEVDMLVKVSQEEQNSSGVCGSPLVIGNVAPVQMREDSAHHPGRILAPYTRNNFKAWLIYSDDDGVSWQGDRELVNMTVTDHDVDYEDAQPDCNRGMSYFHFEHLDHIDLNSVPDLIKFAVDLCNESESPYTDQQWTQELPGPWQFMGVGPPGSLQLRSGRVLVPCYHSYIRGLEGGGKLPVSQLYNNFAFGHVMITDDGGDTWRMSDEWGNGEGIDENQMVELPDGTVLTNARSLSTGSPQWRVQARSFDSGETFSASELTSIQQPFNGCQGSTVSAGNETVFVSGPDPLPATSWLQKVMHILHCGANLTGRSRVTLWRSDDGGRTYPNKTLIDPGLSAQTSLQHHNGKLYMLYEQADPGPQVTLEDMVLDQALQNLRVLLPTRFVFREVPI